MDIHIFVGGQQIGPFSPEETRRRIAAGEFQLSDLAWTEGQAGWVPLSTLPGFTSAYTPPPLPGGAPGRMPVRPTPMASQPSGASGLAVTSLILGIFSVTILSILAGIPAVICGHIARSRVRKAGGAVGGGGMALAGLIMGYISFSVIPIAIVAGIALPVFSAVQVERVSKPRLCPTGSKSAPLASCTRSTTLGRSRRTSTTGARLYSRARPKRLHLPF